MALLRWQQLRNFADATALAWPFASVKAVEFDLFAATFNRNNVYSFTMMLEYPAIASFSCNLTCFRVFVGL